MIHVYWILLYLIGILLLCIYLKNKWSEGFENNWVTSYNTWKTEYTVRHTALCPLFTKVDTSLTTAGEPSLDARNKIKLSPLTPNPTKEVHDGKPLVDCSKLVIPENPSIDDALTFFSNFPDDAEAILLRSIKLINPIMKEQLDQVNKSLSDIPPMPTTTTLPLKQGFEDLCSDDAAALKELMNKAAKCKSVTDLPENKKLEKLQSILQKHNANLQATAAEFNSQLQEALKAEKEINKIKEQAETGTLPVPQIG